LETTKPAEQTDELVFTKEHCKLQTTASIGHSSDKWA